MDRVRKLLLGVAALSIAAGVVILLTLTGLGTWFAIALGTAAVFVLTGSNLVAWAFGSSRVDAEPDEDPSATLSPVQTPAVASLVAGDADGR